MTRLRTNLKHLLALAPDPREPNGATVLIYHRVGGPGRDELDVTVADFERQLDVLSSHRVDALDEAVAALESGDAAHRVVISFDDGFRDVYENAWPRLRDRGLPFIVYVASSRIDATMDWAGSTAKETGVPALTWTQLGEMVQSGLCTVGNHTHSHVRPELLSENELDRCTETVQQQLGVTPEHFAFPWGQPVPQLDPALRTRFRTAATSQVTRNVPGVDLMRLGRVPVRGSDPVPFFAAKLRGELLAERLYGVAVSTAK